MNLCAAPSLACAQSQTRVVNEKGKCRDPCTPVNHVSRFVYLRVDFSHKPPSFFHLIPTALAYPPFSTIRDWCSLQVPSLLPRAFSKVSLPHSTTFFLEQGRLHKLSLSKGLHGPQLIIFVNRRPQSQCLQTGRKAVSKSCRGDSPGGARKVGAAKR